MPKKLTKLVVGNWKMNLTPAEAVRYVKKLRQFKPLKDVELVICPPIIDLTVAAEALSGSDIKLAAQNLFYEQRGAYTGETSPLMLTGLVSYVIVGHSERRLHFGEKDNQIALKLKAAIGANITPILAIGETLKERQSGEYKTVISHQLAVGLAELTSSEVEQIVIAYEPVWAIGTGVEMKPHQVESMFEHIKSVLEALFDLKVGKLPRLLYGGSVHSGDFHTYQKVKSLDGFLIGGASTDPNEFYSIAAGVSRW